MNRRSAATSGGAEIQKNVTGFLKDNAAMIALLIIVLLLIALFAPQFFSVQILLRTLPGRLPPQASLPSA